LCRRRAQRGTEKRGVERIKGMNGTHTRGHQVILSGTTSAGSLEAMEKTSKTWTSLEDYCKFHGGDHVISRILIANNGIAAVKCIRSMRRWALAELGIENALTFVCMATPEDIQVK
jgi:hypothetical protein